MSRKRTGFTKEEVIFGRNYIDKKFLAKNWPSRETHQKAFADYKQRPTVGKYADDEVTRWCNKWLNPTQWAQLRNTMRSWRFRKKATEPPKDVRLSLDAWKIITTLAEREKKSVSLFIIDRLTAEYETKIDNGKLVVKK